MRLVSRFFSEKVQTWVQSLNFRRGLGLEFGGIIFELAQELDMDSIFRYGHIRKLRSEIYYNRPDQNISDLRFKPIHDLLLNNINWNEDFSAAEEIHVTLDINT